MSSDPINRYDSLEPVYGSQGLEDAKARYDTIAQAFEAKFGAPPDFFARAPGRVNLIGEHIDYEGYGVLPMALALDTIVAIRKPPPHSSPSSSSSSSTTLQISHLFPEKYPDTSFSVDPNQPVDVSHHSWANYFLSAYKGVWEACMKDDDGTINPFPTPQGLQVMIHGTVPLGGGVSSSAALVCASSLAILAAHGIQMTKGQVAEFTALAERHVGVTSGGMDQAISIMGMPGCAKLVDFNPVRTTDVHLPAEASFVICNSLAVSNKAEKATKQYNLRVVECRLASALMAIALGKSREEAVDITTLKQVEEIVLLLLQQQGSDSATTGTEAVEAAKQYLHEQLYTHQDIETTLGGKLTDLYQGDAAALRVLEANPTFNLRDRAIHVYTEKQRVIDFAAACKQADDGTDDTTSSSGTTLETLGALMDASHQSLKDLYECSSPELDTLVGIARKAGAIGARLTGAGWGGCTVSLVKRGEEDGFIKKVTEEYLRPLMEEGRLMGGGEDLKSTIFASLPSSGAAILDLKY